MSMLAGRRARRRRTRRGSGNWNGKSRSSSAVERGPNGNAHHLGDQMRARRVMSGRVSLVMVLRSPRVEHATTFGLRLVAAAASWGGIDAHASTVQTT